MHTIPWPPGRDDIHAGVVVGTQPAGDGALLRLQLAGGAQACTLVDDTQWTIGDWVHVHFTRMLGGSVQIVRVRKAVAARPEMATIF